MKETTKEQCLHDAIWAIVFASGSQRLQNIALGRSFVGELPDDPEKLKQILQSIVKAGEEFTEKWLCQQCVVNRKLCPDCPKDKPRSPVVVARVRQTQTTQTQAFRKPRKVNPPFGAQNVDL